MKPKRTYPCKTNEPSALDLCGTPPYALEPLLPYIPKYLRIWEPACGEGILANALRIAGYDVIETDIELGQDFFEYQPPKWDVIITNPPYGIKPAWTEHCYELGKAFALLMPTEFQGTGAAAEMFDHYGVEIMNLTPRVDFKMPVEKWFSCAQFPVSWYCSQILPSQLMFEFLRKPSRTESRQVWKRDKKTGFMKLITERGYGDWTERPVRYDPISEKFEYDKET
jgi:hypothetical protein